MSDTAKTFDPRLLEDIRRYGAFDIASCFNCGNCTAVCPLSVDADSFPRKMIRAGQVGFREPLLEGSEPWLCYYCGECSDTCPRQAEPGEYMAALRRWVIAKSDPLRLAGATFRHPLLLVVFSLVLAVLLALSLVQWKGETGHYAHWIFANLVPYEAIHWIGVGVGVLCTLLIAAGVYNLVSNNLRPVGGLRFLWKSSPANLLDAARFAVSEVLTMKRHDECRKYSTDNQPWYLRPRFVHGFILWGFLGLAVATSINFLMVIVLDIVTFTVARTIGTISGVALVYGVTVAIFNRLSGKEKHAAHTHSADAWLLGFLFVLGVSGFWLELVVTMGWRDPFHDWVLLVHTAMAMELVLLVAVTKLAHAIYRPLVLFLHRLKQKGSAT